jgi:hypothetical protein
MHPLAQMLIQEYLAALRPGGGLDETDFNASLFRPVKKTTVPARWRSTLTPRPSTEISLSITAA